MNQLQGTPEKKYVLPNIYQREENLLPPVLTDPTI